MDFYELQLQQDETVELSLLEEVAGKLNEIIKDNLDVTPEAEFARDFYPSSGSLILSDRYWGVERHIQDDMIALSEAYPDIIFKLVKTWAVDSFNHLEDLENYWRGDFGGGRLIDTYKPRAIEWKSDSERNWYVEGYEE